MKNKYIFGGFIIVVFLGIMVISLYSKQYSVRE